MGALLDTLTNKRLLVADGAWGTLLQAQGLGPGYCPELWNLDEPEKVRSVAAAYTEAGADLVLTNTFGGSTLALKRHGLADRTEELNAAGARLSLEGAGEKLVAASIGPTGEFLPPMGSVTEQEMTAAFETQIRAILHAGVRILCIETMTAVEEAVCAVRAARTVAKEISLPVEVMATMTFTGTPKGYRTFMGVDCQTAVEKLSEAGADVLGSNCGNGIEQMVPIAVEFRQLTDKPILIQPNAGLPEIENGVTVFRQSPEHMAKWIPPLVEAGISILGGCCGTTPEHIRAIRRQIDRLL
ncbi:MAG: homocysteine S-methyltransferase family protein [Spirochaetia bacterium]|jgi:5-methyltetrahydrofolate--homocysteine methyltransferase|nr:homocysteine S-methyltransferase family protein [Spirochaetales bacterium]